VAPEWFENGRNSVTRETGVGWCLENYGLLRLRVVVKMITKKSRENE
jgi:hypothetical protein